MRSSFTLLLFALCTGHWLQAQETITITDADLVGETTYDWTSDNEYVLDGLVFLEAGGVLNIEAGTVIRGANSADITTGDPTSALIIARDAQIFARGTADAPIIFTAFDDDVNDPGDLTTADRGDWGGLIILGNATIARPNGEDNIEGIESSEARATFGGTDDEDNSGVLNYVSIRHGGAQLSTDNEINGLTLGGVGSGTEIDFIEVFANLDDGIEWFGGTVNVKHASVSFCGDDSYDYDYGWRGNGQFWFSIQEPANGTGRAGEHDGASPDEQEPFSQPTISNATFIGVGSDATPAGGDALRGNPAVAVLFRDNAAGYYWNSIFTGFNGAAIALENLADSDVDSYARFQAGDLDFRNNIFDDFGEGNTAADLFLAYNGTEQVDEAASAAIATALTENNEIGTPGLAGISRTADGGLDPRINAGGLALGGGSVETLEGDFFTLVSYRGAFGNSALWLNGWTALSSGGYLGDLTTPIDNNDCITITDADLAPGETYTWGGGDCYNLDGLVYLEADATLTIEAGTVIRGLNVNDISTGDNTSALIVARDAQIFARGTAAAPIIFTAAGDDLSDPNDLTVNDRGEWGGVIILGNATIARPGGEDNIEGIESSETRATFGGTDDEDDSGVLNYVSIRHAGAQLSTDNEINGLTLGGVGSGTEIDYIEVFANLDDGIEWFGGTVRVDHAAVSFCGDDGYDYDYGWRGGGQYWFSLQAPNSSTGRAGEHDGASPDGQTPFSQPTIYNATYIGIGEDATASGGDALRGNPAVAILFRDNAAGYYYNSIFTDFNGAAVAVEALPDNEGDSYARLQAGDLAFYNNYFFGFGEGSEPTDIWIAYDESEVKLEAETAVVAANFVANGNLIADPQLNSITDRDEDGAGLDPRVYAFGDAATGAPAAIDGFETTDYYGAFAPGAYSGNSMGWYGGWTALSEYMLIGDFTNGTGQVERNGFLLDAPVPNPAYQNATVSFELPTAARVNLTVLDLMGRPLTRIARDYTAGTQIQNLDVSQLPNGTYLIVLDAAGSRLLQKMVVAH
ncbi:T9SS type A sorting domain-containing protein [Lewinella sp. IMCC34183]|uniref:T9SS type A sorting domain-containing protein n=1 Tax=Lewinella sp. IMCC34183 TaxID=2248762 RepID=UPI000E251A44|nr:T9SS type A sorting domain-containing protein [Lewinella sp. IMCC34183]